MVKQWERGIPRSHSCFLLCIVAITEFFWASSNKGLKPSFFQRVNARLTKLGQFA